MYFIYRLFGSYTVDDYPRNAFHVNIEGTFNVLEACVRHNVKKLIFSSSASVYGNPVELPMREDLSIQ